MQRTLISLLLLFFIIQVRTDLIRAEDEIPTNHTQYQQTINENSFIFHAIEKELAGRYHRLTLGQTSFYHQLFTLLASPLKKRFSLDANTILTAENEDPIRVTFAGDAMFDWSVKQTIQQKGPDYPFVHIKPELDSSDLSIVNLETAVTTRGTQQGKQYTFRSDPLALTGLKNAGFQLVSLANNHSLDFGQQGFIDTLNNIKKVHMDYVGAGMNMDEAYSAKTYTIKDRKVKIVAFSRVLPDYNWVATDTKPGLANGYDIQLMEEVIRKEKVDADYLFVFLHWGVEKNRSPEPYQREWAKRMIDSGADGVIGSHPHRLQGFEYYKGKPIAYSLGNFLFPNYIKGDAAQTGLLQLDINNNIIDMTFVPFRISNDQIVMQTEEQKSLVWRELQGLSFGNLQIQNGRIEEGTAVAENGK